MADSCVIVQFDQPTSVQQVRAALDKSFPGGGENVIVQSFGDPATRQVMIRVPHVGAEQGTSLSQTKQQVVDALTKGGVGGFKENGTQIVGPAVGQELRSKALHQSALAHILAFNGKSHHADRVIDLRWVGLQIDRLQLFGFQIVPEEVAFFLGVAPDKELNRLSDARQGIAESGRRQPKVSR